MLQDNGGDNLSLTANGSFTFATALASGAAYSVTVKTNPSGQTCTVSAGSGTVASANVTNVAVSCAAAASFSVGGTVSGLSGTVVLQDNGGDNLSLTANGSFTFATALASGAAYSVTVQTNPSGQTCTVSAGSGTVASANVTNVTVSCAANAAGTASDNFNRADGGLGANWTAISDGAMAISSQAVIGTVGATTGDIWTASAFASDQYSQIRSPRRRCPGASGSRRRCGSRAPGRTTFTVGGSVSGLSGTVVLQDNGGDNLSVTANGSFTFATSLASGAAYSVTVGTNPSGQTCTVSSGSGTVGTANVTSVTVTCQSIGPLTVSYVSTDTNGVATYNMTSPIVSGGTTEPLRVLTPTNPAPGVAHNFLIALPVEPGEGTTYGDAMSTLESLNAQNQYNLTIVEPSFAIDPWYADSATDPNELMETFMTDQLVPWIKAHLATTGKEQVWLIGFSKSGVGAQDLILKHPNVYTLAASWDFPDSPSYDALGSSEATAYGTNANFLANYQLSQNFVNTYAAPFAQQKRLWIGGYYYFDWDVYNDYAPELTNAHVLYDAESATQMAHNWGSGWVPGALAALYHDSINLSS